MIYTYIKEIGRLALSRKMRWISIGFLSVVLTLYLLVGGAIFMVLEKHHEDMVTTTQQNVFKKFLSKYSFTEEGIAQSLRLMHVSE